MAYIRSVYQYSKYYATHTPTFNGPLSGTTQVSRYQKGKTNLDFTEASDSEWQWHQVGHMQVCTSLQTDNHASTSPLRYLQAGCPSCHPTNSIRALKAQRSVYQYSKYNQLTKYRGRSDVIRGFLKCYALYKSTFYLLTYLLTYI